MSLTITSAFECPYCMTTNEIEIDEQNDVGQQQIVDCQICCQPIEIVIYETEFGLTIQAKRDDD